MPELCSFEGISRCGVNGSSIQPLNLAGTVMLADSNTSGWTMERAMYWHGTSIGWSVSFLSCTLKKSGFSSVPNSLPKRSTVVARGVSSSSQPVSTPISVLNGSTRLKLSALICALRARSAES